MTGVKKETQKDNNVNQVTDYSPLFDGLLQEAIIEGDKAVKEILNKSADLISDTVDVTIDSAIKNVEVVAEKSIEALGEIVENTGEILGDIISEILKP